MAAPPTEFDFSKPFTVVGEEKPEPIVETEKELTGQEKIYERLRKRKEAEKEAEGRAAEIEREQAARAREWYEKIPELERDERERKHWETQKRLAPFYREIAQDRKAWVDKVTRLSETLPLTSEEDRRKEARSLAKEEEDALIRKLDEFEGEFGLRFKHFGKSLDAIEMDQEVGTAMAKARTALGGKTVGPAPPRSPYGAFRSSEAARKLWVVVGPEGKKTNVGGVEAFMQRLGKKKETPPGMGEFTVIRNGNVERYAVDSGVAEAINSFGEKQHAAWRLLAHTSRPLKVGATKWSAPFQIVNALLSDLPTNALTARTGLRVNPIDWARFIAVDYPVAFARAFMGNMGKPGDFYREAARSGLTGQTLKNAIDPDYNLVGRLPRFDGMLQGTTVERGVQGFEKGARWIDVIPDAIEEMGKLVGIERALRQERGLGFFEKVPKIKDKNGRYIRNMERFFEENPEWRREVMKQMGSPQFSVSGRWGRQMDVLFMFYNARMQGAARDLQRVTDLKSPEGRKAVARMMGAVVLPTVWHAINNQRDYREDYLNTSQQERDNYWIFFKESFVAAHGTDIEKMNLVKSLDKDGNGLILEDEIPAHLRKFFKRDAIKLPKRDLLRGVANIAEGFVNMAFEKDPDYTIGKAVADIGWRTAGDFGPLELGSDISGIKEGLISQSNPAVKYLYETASGDNIRDSWRKRYLMPQRRGVTPDPSEQRKPSTEAGYIAAANLYGGSPIRLKHAVETWTADLIGQFVPKRKVKGRKYYDSETLNHIKGMFLSRFVASNFMVDERRQKYLEKKLKEDATQAMKANRIAGDWVEENVKDVDAEDVGNFGTKKTSELWLRMHRKYSDLGEFSEDTRIRTAIQNRLNGIQKKLTWDEKTSLSLTPMKRAELYLKDFNERWPTPTKELDQASKNQRELEQLQWRNYLTGTGFLNGATERALVNIAVEEGSQKKK